MQPQQGNELILFFSSILGVAALIGNIFWQWKYKNISNSKQLIDTLIAQNDAKQALMDSLQADIEELKDEKEKYKMQFHNLRDKYKDAMVDLKELRTKCNLPHTDPLA